MKRELCQIHQAKWLRARTKGSVLAAITGLGLFAFAVFSGCAGYTAKTAGGSPPLWSANMETGDLSQWFFPMNGPVGNFGGDIENSGIASAVASTDFAHSGKYSAKLTITTPDSPTSGARLFRWAEAQTYPQLYYSVWYYFPQSYTPALFWNVLQWKSKHVVSGAAVSDPFFSLEVGSLPNGEMFFYLGDDHLGTTFQQSAQSLIPVPVGRWFNVQAFYKCDASGAGEVKIWQDGTQLWDVPNVDTRYADGDCAWSVNNYSSGLSPASATIYIDDAAIGLEPGKYP